MCYGNNKLLVYLFFTVVSKSPVFTMYKYYLNTKVSKILVFARKSYWKFARFFFSSEYIEQHTSYIIQYWSGGGNSAGTVVIRSAAGCMNSFSNRPTGTDVILHNLRIVRHPEMSKTFNFSIYL